MLVYNIHTYQCCYGLSTGVGYDIVSFDEHGAKRFVYSGREKDKVSAKYFAKKKIKLLTNRENMLN